MSFDTEEEVDFVEITIGGRTLSQMDSPALARLSGDSSSLLTSYYSYNNHMTITFSSDSANHGSFDIRIKPGKDRFTLSKGESERYPEIIAATQCD